MSLQAVVLCAFWTMCSWDRVASATIWDDGFQALLPPPPPFFQAAVGVRVFCRAHLDYELMALRGSRMVGMLDLAV